MHKDPLAPLTNLEPEKLVSKDGKDSLAEFILALSLVFRRETTDIERSKCVELHLAR
jgi:hypothetical protein